MLVRLEPVIDCKIHTGTSEVAEVSLPWSMAELLHPSLVDPAASLVSELKLFTFLSFSASFFS